MAFAPYTNDRRTEDQPLILGVFTEVDYGHQYEFAERGDMFPADFHPEMPHVMFVGQGFDNARLANVKKTVLTMISGDGVVEKWMIKGHRLY